MLGSARCLACTVLLGLSSPAVAQDAAPAPTSAPVGPFADVWQQPLAIAPPVPLRSVQLPGPSGSQADLAAQARVLGLAGYRAHRKGGQWLLDVPMDDERWARFRAEQCDAGRGIQCPANPCHEIASRAASEGPRLRLAEDPAIASERVAARLATLRETQSDDRLPQCRALPPIAGARGLDPAPGQRRGINLDLDLRWLTEDRASRPATRGPAASASLPADSDRYRLLAENACTTAGIPLDSLQPARIPGVALALIDSGSIDAVARRQSAAVLSRRRSELLNAELVLLAAADALALVQGLQGDSAVAAAQPEYVYRTSGAVAQDPLAALTYAPAKIDAAPLHQITRGAGQRVAVIDTGIDGSHPDLAGRVTESLDTTGQGHAPDAHGTAVAGVLAAGLGNGIGGYGVAPDVELLAIKACTPVNAGGFAARCRTSTLLAALDLAAQRGSAIVNMSLTGPPDPLLARAIARLSSQGVLIVAAAGNGGPQARPAFPAALPGVLAVTALDAVDRSYGDANLGRYIDLAAPGVELLTTAPGNGYPSVSGTSFAAAVVSGTAALLRALNPKLDGPALRAALLGSVRDLGDAGQDAVFGRGLPSACAAAALPDASLACAGGDR